MNVTKVQGNTPAGGIERGARVEAGNGLTGLKSVASITRGWQQAGTFHSAGSTTQGTITQAHHQTCHAKHG